MATFVALRLVAGDHAYVKLPEPPVAVGDPPNVNEDSGIQCV